MSIYVGQFYIEPGIDFPFSIACQKWLGDQITNLVGRSANFKKQYSGDHDIIFRMSAKKELRKPDIKGPSHFSKDKDVEYSIFLPWIEYRDFGVQSLKTVLQIFIDCVIFVLSSLGFNIDDLAKHKAHLIAHIMTADEMFER